MAFLAIPILLLKFSIFYYTSLITSHEPIVHLYIIIHKKFKEFKASFLNYEELMFSTKCFKTLILLTSHNSGLLEKSIIVFNQ